jgi:hypothetical protein
LEEFQHAELVHGDDEGPFNVVDDLSGSSLREEEGNILDRRGRRWEFWRNTCLRA